MRSRRRILILTTALLPGLTCLLLLVRFIPREPEYEGLTIRDWISSKPRSEREEALIFLGTNNLRLLLHRLEYDPRKDKVIALYDHLPSQVKSQTWLSHLVRRKITMADDAQGVLWRLGPLASPAIPQLTRSASTLGPQPAMRAFMVLDSIGEQARPSIIFLTAYADSYVRIQAMLSLATHTNLPPVHEALTRALTDSDSKIRKQAEDILAGRVFE
jgi:hypothetical protein